jgi:hypothetical protein
MLAGYLHVHIIQSAYTNQLVFNNGVKVFNDKHFVKTFQKLEREFIGERYGGDFKQFTFLARERFTAVRVGDPSGGDAFFARADEDVFIVPLYDWRMRAWGI